jgi:hypothetical protein
MAEEGLPLVAMSHRVVTAILRSPTCRAAFFAVALCTSLVACDKAAPEPETRARSTAEPLVAPLAWSTPAGFVELTRSQVGATRASYRVPRVGDDSEDAELLVLFYGTGSNGDRDKVWSEWFSQFDGDARASAVRERFAAGPNTVETFEHLGDYKLNMGPRKPGMKRSPVQMVKKAHRMIGAVISTPDRGNWFVRLVGGDATVLAAKPALRAMLESAR